MELKFDAHGRLVLPAELMDRLSIAPAGPATWLFFLSPSECFDGAPFVLDVYESCEPRTAFFLIK